jgi:class 3 adenylate cyclase
MENLRTLTVVKTDLSRFTARVNEMTSAELEGFVRDHRDIVVDALRRHGGNLVKGLGDSFLLTFDSSTHALLACVSLQRELAIRELSLPGERRMDVRVAVSAGDVLIQDGDVYGTPVNLVARLEAITPPGQIYLTEAVFQNLNHREIACEPVAMHHFKGLTDPVRVYRTTFRHQTRTVSNATVLFTDVEAFTPFAESADLADVEWFLEFWDAAHREATARFGGVVRLVMGDGYFLTFETPDSAVSAWVELQRRLAHAASAADWPGPSGPTRNPAAMPTRFSAGLAAGDIRVFQSAIYGVAANHAAGRQERSRTFGPNCLVLPKAAVERLEQSLLAELQVQPVPAAPEGVGRHDDEALCWATINKNGNVKAKVGGSC